LSKIKKEDEYIHNKTSAFKVLLNKMIKIY